MPTDHIRYDLLAQQALRGVVQRVLTDAAKNGLPGDHHFYVSFDTRAPGVRISQRLRDEYPEEMTIILQHQFWDLTVTEDEFEVGLSFKGIPERLGVPFAAIKGFFDPSVQFALQFEAGGKEGAEATDAQASPPSEDQPSAKPRSARSKGAKTSGAIAPVTPAQPPTVVPSAPAATSDESGDKPDRPAGGAEVVRLDRFRKK
jgi:hypothetical protein